MEKDILEGRLADVYAAASSYGKGSRIIDVGSDHGHLAGYAVAFGGFSGCICTDIHKAPAERSARFLAENGLSSKSSVYCTNGLTGIDILTGDTIVMAGLGGNNIMDIMNEMQERTLPDILKTVTFVFQPQKTIEGLREYLYSKGFCILDETVSFDRGIYYPIIVAKFDGCVRELSLKEKYYGPVLLTKDLGGDPKVGEYFIRLRQRHSVWARGDEEVRQLIEEETT